MQTGQLDQRITLLRPTFTTDGLGASVPGTPTDLGQKWANVSYMNGYELEQAAQRWAEVRYKITIRRQPGLTLQLTDYIEWNSQTLDLLDIRGPGTRDDFWILMAKDHVA